MKNRLGECDEATFAAPFLRNLPDQQEVPCTQTTSQHQKEQNILSPPLCKVKSISGISVPFSQQRPAWSPSSAFCRLGVEATGTEK